MDSRFILVTLLVKLGVAAAVSSAVVRSRYFKELLFQEERTLQQKVHLTLFIATPFALGVLVRVAVRNFQAADLSVEAAILLGVIGGRVAGATGGALLGLAALYNGELAALPFDMLVGFAGGMLRDAAPNKEDIWAFTPFMDLSLYRWVRRNLPRPAHGLAEPVFPLHSGHATGAHAVGTAAAAPLLLDSGSYLDHAARPVRDHRRLRRHSAQDLEQHPHRDEAAGAGAPAAASTHGGPAEPDQPSFPV